MGVVHFDELPNGYVPMLGGICHGVKLNLSFFTFFHEHVIS